MTERFEKDQELIKYVYGNFNGVPIGDDEYEKMISGVQFTPVLKTHRIKTHQRCQEYHQLQLSNYSSPQHYENAQLCHLQTIFGKLSTINVSISSPIHLDYGYNISINHNTQISGDLTILDGGIVTIGHHVRIGPHVCMITTSHPLDTTKRVDEEYEWAREITIGDFVTIGSRVTIVAGVNVGNGALVKDGSVVVRDVPANCVVTGSPAKVVKRSTRAKCEL